MIIINCSTGFRRGRLAGEKIYRHFRALKIAYLMRTNSSKIVFVHLQLRKLSLERWDNPFASMNCVDQFFEHTSILQ